MGYLRFWLNSIVVHTINNETNKTAPICLVGTRKDIVSDREKHLVISRLLTERFEHHKAWASIVFPDSDGAGEGLCFFAVDNVHSRSDAELLKLSNCIECTIKDMPSTSQNLPLSWLAALDELQALHTGSLTYSNAVEICTAAGVAPADIEAFLNFLKEMGILLWLDEAALRDVVIMDAISYLVVPATLVICQHVIPAPGDQTVHHEPVHKECAQQLPIEWKQLLHSAILNESLLAILWQDFIEHKDKLIMLMTKYGLLVPFFQTAEEEAAGVARTHLVPALLSWYVIDIKQYRNWSEETYHSCMFVFTTVAEFENYSKISRDALEVYGFLPSGLFERVIGKAVSWCQTTSRDGLFNIHNALLRRNMVICDSD